MSAYALGYACAFAPLVPAYNNVTQYSQSLMALGLQRFMLSLPVFVTCSISVLYEYTYIKKRTLSDVSRSDVNTIFLVVVTCWYSVSYSALL